MSTARTTCEIRRPGDEGEDLAAALCERAWILGTIEGTCLSPQLTLEPDGEIGGVADPALWSWSYDEDRLQFRHRSGAARFRFAQSTTSTDARMIFLHHDHARGAVTHYLMQTDRIARNPHPEQAQRLVPLARRRQNLVVIRADATSLHTQWARDIEDAERTWDFCISWYGSEGSFAACEPAEYMVLQNRDRKFTSIHRLCYAASPIFDYDFVAFLDDDIALGWSDLNALFAIASDRKLALCQPSLTAESFISHEITRQQPGKLLRYTNFVEVMCPVFSGMALRRCAGTFALSDSAWGLDIIWPQVLGGHRHRIAVIDAVGVTHTRPPGHSYDFRAAQADTDRLSQAFQAQAPYHPREHGVLL